MLYSFFLIIMKNVGRSSAFRPRYPNIYYRTSKVSPLTQLYCTEKELRLFNEGKVYIWTEKNAALCALLMGLCCAANFGVNPLLNALIPMDYDKSGRVGLVAGLIDCFIYIGSALTGVAAGAVIDVVGWQGVYAMWIVGSAIGAGFGIAAIRGEKCMKNQINV